MADNATISPKQRAAIAELLTSANVTKAAEAAGVVPSTVYRWRQEPGFAAELKRRQRESLDDVMLALHQLTRGAVNAYSDALRSGTNMSYRLRAADAVFSHLIKLQDYFAIADELNALWEAINGKEERKQGN